ncbi:uncharacterized protein FMAN_09641 [Fusarium mangiferae]|uniref:Uncharacterized protein n=1 Tax=Fusarium mangiferae TaxID=192010 RepID=A0A1L7UCB4_FUSMA|nr:uncharacterized protein FMAN_09641 [Fusarium mangiferae]CVL08049.1 uncharacterized protein FMAN_09641 [Fusarium mangiferae]
MTSLASTNPYGPGPSQAVPNTSLPGKYPSKSQDKLREKVLQIVKSLRTALPAGDETFSFDNENSTTTPRFGDLSQYNVVDIYEKYLWETEVNRILSRLNNPQQPLESALSRELASSINSTGFTWLERLSDQLLCALSIYGLDDNLMVASESQRRISDRGFIIGRSFERLERRLGSVPEIIRKGGIRERHAVRRDIEVNEQYMLRDGVVGVTDSEAPIYYHLVDYVTETLARLLCDDFTSDEVDWVSIVVTVLAKYSTKLKVLSSELPKYGVEALDRHSHIRQDLGYYPVTAAENPSEISLDVTAGFLDRDNNSNPTRGPGDRYIATYSSDMSAISNWIFRLLWHIFSDLNIRNTRSRQTDEFEVSAVVFSAGSRGIPTITFQNRLGHISGSSSGVAVGMFRRAFGLLRNTAFDIQNSSSQAIASRRVLSQLSIQRGASFSVELKTMAEVMSVMVISSCMDPSAMDDMVRLCASLRVSHILTRIYDSVQGFKGFVSLYNTLSRKDLTSLRRSLPLSDYFDSTGNYRLPSQLRQVERNPRQHDLEAIRAVEEQIPASKRKRVSDSASKWAIEEHAVSVSCLPYTLSILVGCAILVLGGLMAGFFVGSRIDGVDPFNITMFAWIVAAFIILVSKSIRVGEWTWRDFLKSRVTCRTVSELANVTNLPEQNIIMHLLSSERETPLVFRGPYNNVFSNTGAEGFSVDVKPTVGTLFASGLIVLEVLVESGSALVCLDLRPVVTTIDSDTEGNSHNPSIRGYQVVDRLGKQRMVHRQRKPCRVLACKDPPIQDETEKDILFRKQVLHWEKIIGVYNRLTQTVR